MLPGACRLVATAVAATTDSVASFAVAATTRAVAAAALATRRDGTALATALASVPHRVDRHRLWRRQLHHRDRLDAHVL